MDRSRWTPLIYLDAVDGTEAYRPTIAYTIGARRLVVTDFGVLNGGEHPYPPGHPFTPGNAGLADWAERAKRKVGGGVRFALLKGDKYSYADAQAATSGMTVRNAVILVHDAALPAAELERLCVVLLAEFQRHTVRVGARVGRRKKPLSVPPKKIRDHDGDVGGGPVLGGGARGGGGVGGRYDNEDDDHIV